MSNYVPLFYMDVITYPYPTPNDITSIEKISTMLYFITKR